ncbi:MAG: Asp23/Gls24 family envelope stress response protein [Clostridia bacterium]|nr:Asp23/Gls24 family envelope stress response protein [Clostridia bacterium]
MPQNNSENTILGSIAISDDLLASCVADSVLSMDGVVDLEEVVGTAYQIPLIDGDVGAAKGVRIEKKSDKTIIDVYVIVRYGVKIPQLAWDLQQNIRRAFASITGETVEEINIHVRGVSKEENDETA